ncbi:winged helix-turn-helix domain-containing protein [Pseudoalteromonas sp. S16_S37]|uniref:winged helix-turn-helix domain-containing protein n=1 Tax=Pseudoalteromonas sp. S16_S37 TaxID=2720228 RepID=UPI0016811CB1|nr:winged helix-turn-helix domain-containing protein [Pseudoalteromonas sp. S16_S37]MBD1581097.1 CadC family transcriptional regulator [Pseudoalteromonas sp. S16_S37]
MVDNLNKRFLINEILIDFDNLSVKVDGSKRSIEAKHAALLYLLISNKGQVVTREEILNAVWPGTIVSDNSVSQLVAQLRRLLGDNSSNSKIIKTVPRIGYQCIAQIEKAPSLLEKVEVLSRGRGAHFGAMGFVVGVLITALIAVGLEYWYQQTQQSDLQETRITSSPGAEVFIRFSPNGKYLAYSYLAQGADQFDLAVYDLETKITHTIKNSGYSEESASWSNDGQWLIYSRSDPVSCEVRALNTKGPIETWRLARDMVLERCNSAQDSAPWLEYQPGYFISKAWDKHGAYLQLVEVALESDSVRVIAKKPLPFRDITHYQVKAQSLLYQSQGEGIYSVHFRNLGQADFESAQLSSQTYATVSQGLDKDTLLVAKQGIELWDKHEKRTVYAGFGGISELDVNRQSSISAHTEGIAEINFYELEITDTFITTQKQLTSSSRMDLNATVSKDGANFVYASVSANNRNQQQFELWHKHVFRPTSSLLGMLPVGEVPHMLLLAPDGDYLAVLSKANRVFLVSMFTKEVKKVIDGFTQIANLSWDEKGKRLFYKAKLGNEQPWQAWSFDISIGQSERKQSSISDSSLPIEQKNISFINYQDQLRRLLINKLDSQFDVEQLRVSLSLYQPAAYQDGIYFVLKKGHQLLLYRYLSKDDTVKLIQPIGLHLYSGVSELQVVSSFDGSKVIFNRINNYESDIVLLRH